MLQFSADVKIKRPVNKVFAWLTNADNQRKFDKSSLAMDFLTPGPWRTGSQFREIRDLGGRKTEVFSEVAELELNQRFGIRSKTGPDWLGTWMFEPEGGGTRVRWTGQMKMKGFARLLEPMIGKQMRQSIKRQFAQLPSIIEGDISE